MSSVEIIESSICICVDMPKGSHGLEGYSLGSAYKYSLVKMDGKNHYRVYPSKEDPSYYETCSTKAFNTHFKRKNNG